MKEFLYLFRGGDARTVQQSPEEMQAHMERWMKWMGELQQNGQLQGGQPLENDGKVVKGSQKMVTDGPFTEAKEVVGGYLIVKAESLEAATELSKGCPILDFEDGTVEIREIHQMSM